MQLAQSEIEGLPFYPLKQKYFGEKLCASSQYTCWLPREKTMPIGLPGRLQSLKEQRPSLVLLAVDSKLKIYIIARKAWRSGRVSDCSD
jgi:hypothetical protein